MADLFIYQPFKLRDDRGAIAVTDDPDRHLRDKLLAILFTAPGASVNRPDFCVGLDRALFDPLDSAEGLTRTPGEPLDRLAAAAIERRSAEAMRHQPVGEEQIDAVDVDF